MLARIERFFRERLQTGSDADNGIGVDELPLACAALMFEVVRADQTIDAAELERFRDLLRRELDIAEEDLEFVEALAEQEAEEATDLFQFTQLVTRHCGVEERVRLVERLWQVAWADGTVAPLEEHTIRRIAGLIHVRDSDFIAAKQRAREANAKGA